VTIPTDAVAALLAEVQDYLARDGSGTADGKVIAVIGDYGAGKTHIALELLIVVAGATRGHFHPFYLDAPADTFVALYRERFIPKLSRAEVRDRVEEYFADIVAKELARSSVTAGLADQLRERKVSPMEVVRSLGLMESELLQELRSALKQVTEKDDFGTALALFLRPEFEDAVWEWLKCGPPDAALVERGIARTLDTESAVLEAIGVLAFLYGRQDHRFVLIIDEMEKLISGPGRGEGTILALKKLMEVMGKTGALLLLVGLPDFLEALPIDAQQRLSAVVRARGLSAEETLKYVREANRQATGRSTLKPFSAATVRYLTEISGGNARRIIRLCHHGWQAANAAGTDVTQAMLREVAREQFELASPEDIESALTRTIDSRGWRVERDIKRSGITVDFWLPVGEAGDGCAVLVSRSVLQAQEAEKLRDAAIALQGGRNDTVLAMLVVNGHVSDAVRPGLDESFEHVIEHREREFTEDLQAKLSGLIARLEQGLRESTLETVRDRVEQITRQSSALHSELRTLSERAVTAPLLTDAVQRGLRAVFGTLAGVDDRDRGHSDPRFPEVSSRFSTAERLIDEALVPMQNVAANLFSRDGTPRPSDELSLDGVYEVRRMIDEGGRLLTLLPTLDLVVAAFRRSVFATLDTANHFPRINGSD